MRILDARTFDEWKKNKKEDIEENESVRVLLRHFYSQRPTRCYRNRFFVSLLKKDIGRLSVAGTICTISDYKKNTVYIGIFVPDNKFTVSRSKCSEAAFKRAKRAYYRHYIAAREMDNENSFSVVLNEIDWTKFSSPLIPETMKSVLLTDFIFWANYKKTDNNLAPMYFDRFSSSKTLIPFVTMMMTSLLYRKKDQVSTNVYERAFSSPLSFQQKFSKLAQLGEITNKEKEIENNMRYKAPSHFPIVVFQKERQKTEKESSKEENWYNDILWS